MSLKTIKAWLDAFSHDSSTANVVFLGGEPTLHNDGIRGKGSYDACIQGIQKAVARGFAASLIYTVSTMNIHELELMPALITDLGINRFFIQVIGLRGKVAFRRNAKDRPDPLQVSRSQWLDIIPAVAQKAAKRGVTVSYPKVYLAPEESFECAGLVAQNYFIFPNGRVYRCPLCEDHPIHSMVFKGDKLIKTTNLNESDLFKLNIAEGCVMNKLIQPHNLSYTIGGVPEYKIACCLLKEEVSAG